MASVGWRQMEEEARGGWEELVHPSGMPMDIRRRNQRLQPVMVEADLGDGGDAFHVWAPVARGSWGSCPDHLNPQSFPCLGSQLAASLSEGVCTGHSAVGECPWATEFGVGRSRSPRLQAAAEEKGKNDGISCLGKVKAWLLSVTSRPFDPSFPPSSLSNYLYH